MKCLCGCGEETKRKNRFIHGHNTRLRKGITHPNYGKSFFRATGIHPKSEFKKGNIPFNQRFLNSKKIKKIKDYYEKDGLSLRSISNKLKISKTGVIGLFKRYKIKIRNPSEATKRVFKENKHPFCNPKIRENAWLKAKKTMLEKGYISKGQKELYKILGDLKIVFIPEKPFQIRNDNKKICSFNSYFLDAYLPNKNLCIEYDGHIKHIIEKRHDEKRDEILLKLYGILTLRIKRKEIFNEDFAKQKIINFVGGNNDRIL